MPDFKKKIVSLDKTFGLRKPLATLQVNLGDMCNQRCAHCHVDAGPGGTKVMSRMVMDDAVSFLAQAPGLMLDITGGCPELNPNFTYFVKKARAFVKSMIVRSNLTVLFESGMDWLPQFYKDNRIDLSCSMPCYTKANVDRQRGPGVFDKSIRALRLLNTLGYGVDNHLKLNLVYNPGGAFLPGTQGALERDYRENLEQFGVSFNHLIAIANAPVKRFKQYLEANGDFDAYMKLLTDNFNQNVAADVMCRDLLSVGWNGIVYDCDFNQALGLSMRDRAGNIMEIRSLKLADIENKEIIFENHCYCCTAGAGSSCKGALAA